MRSRGQIVVGVLLVIVGAGFALLPGEWIEERFGFEPDGGNGALEVAIAVGLIAVGTLLIVAALMRRSDTRGAIQQPESSAQ